jgi:hypothetical protein
MTEVLEISKYHMYADDLQIYHSQPKEMLFEWSLANCLKLNPSKYMVLPLYRNHLLGPLPALFLDDDFIPYVFKAKSLGVTFSYDLNWGDHVCTIYRKVYESLAGLRRLVDVTPFTI